MKPSLRLAFKYKILNGSHLPLLISCLKRSFFLLASVWRKILSSATNVIIYFVISVQYITLSSLSFLFLFALRKKSLHFQKKDLLQVHMDCQNFRLWEQIKTSKNVYLVVFFQERRGNHALSKREQAKKGRGGGGGCRCVRVVARHHGAVRALGRLRLQFRGQLSRSTPKFD